ncbi:hypothetical protein XpopCFBP1817_13755 [Xanthomonas populi]|uniref:Uncharacterized protein n=1 Tax=Xanthomonas populi TaxID=53414 RepID=A0A2S7EM81_9XANT|nr:hypothetical protein XpopCFBP1817_13755 [Xanthomonas populi]
MLTATVSHSMSGVAICTLRQEHKTADCRLKWLPEPLRAPLGAASAKCLMRRTWYGVYRTHTVNYNAVHAS